jgi:hypothetical protein
MKKLVALFVCVLRVQRQLQVSSEQLVLALVRAAALYKALRMLRVGVHRAHCRKQLRTQTAVLCEAFEEAAVQAVIEQSAPDLH